MDGAQELITTPLRVFEFEWYQPVDGYHWEKTTAARTNHLKNRLEKGPYVVSKNGIYSGGLYTSHHRLQQSNARRNADDRLNLKLKRQRDGNNC